MKSYISQSPFDKKNSVNLEAVVPRKKKLIKVSSAFFAVENELDLKKKQEFPGYKRHKTHSS